MTAVTATPPALRWVALFLVACAVLGLFLGFRDQIRRNPPDWFTGAGGISAPPTATPDGARDAVPFDADAAPTAQVTLNPEEPAPKTSAARSNEPAGDAAAAVTQTEAPAALAPAPKLKAAPPPAPKIEPPADPVGDILEAQKPPEAPAAVPY
jgi:hypothetical protein